MTTHTADKHQMVRDVHDTYQARLSEVRATRSELERQLSRVNHEIRRLEQHVGRMDEFCTTHDIELTNKGKE